MEVDIKIRAWALAGRQGLSIPPTPAPIGATPPQVSESDTKKHATHLTSEHPGVRRGEPCAGTGRPMVQRLPFFIFAMQPRYTYDIIVLALWARVTSFPPPPTILAAPRTDGPQHSPAAESYTSCLFHGRIRHAPDFQVECTTSRWRGSHVENLWCRRAVRMAPWEDLPEDLSHPLPKTRFKPWTWHQYQVMLPAAQQSHFRMMDVGSKWLLAASIIITTDNYRY